MEKKPDGRFFAVLNRGISCVRLAFSPKATTSLLAFTGYYYTECSAVSLANLRHKNRLANCHFFTKPDERHFVFSS
jgi:hypothetical protein